MSDDSQALMASAAYAPFAGFVVVAGADGDVDEQEVRAFIVGLKRVTDPLLVEMIRAAPEPLDERVAVLTEKTELIASSLAAAGLLFARHPQGAAAREAFLGVLHDVAAAHGEVGDPERRMLERVEQALNVSLGSTGLRLDIAAQGGGAIFGIVSVWQIISAGAGWTAWFVPVAAGLQLMVMVALLWVLQLLGHRYWQQLVAGTVASAIAGVLIAGSSMVVSTMAFPEVLEATGGTAVEGAVGGLIGTLVTGIVISAVLGIFLRRR